MVVLLGVMICVLFISPKKETAVKPKVTVKNTVAKSPGRRGSLFIPRRPPKNHGTRLASMECGIGVAHVGDDHQREQPDDQHKLRCKGEHEALFEGFNCSISDTSPPSGNQRFSKNSTVQPCIMSRAIHGMIPNRMVKTAMTIMANFSLSAMSGTG